MSDHQRPKPPVNRRPLPYTPSSREYLGGVLITRLSQALVAGDEQAAAVALETLAYVVGKAEAARIERELRGGA